MSGICVPICTVCNILMFQGDCQVKYPDVKGISGPSKAKKEIDEQIQRSLQNEGHRCLPISEEILKKHDLLTSCELRQFRCPKCLQPFWRTVLHHKPVASCKQCNLPLCPLKRTEEFGIGRFICGNPTCSNVFYGRCQATDTRQCKNCLKDVKEPYIHPRFRPPFGPLPPGVQKPPARTYNQVSKVHTRTGSTISDFVRQWDETTCTDSLRPDDDDGDNDSGDDGDGPPPQMPTIDFEKGEACHDSDEEDDYDPEAERRRPHGSIPAQEGIDGDSEDSDSD